MRKDGAQKAASASPPAKRRRCARPLAEKRAHADKIVNGSATFPGVIAPSAYFLFRPDFLRSVLRDGHRELLKALGITQALGAATTVREMYETVYDEMRRTHRTEYLFKNEVIRRVFEARHDPDDATVLLERHIAGWKSRVDLIVVNSTTSAYEIKTDRDDLTRVRAQTDLSLSTFDRVLVVCSERWADAVLEATDERVGVYAMRRSGALVRRRQFTPNAKNVDPAAVFSMLRRSEYIAAIERHIGPMPRVDDLNRYAVSLDLFKRISPHQAHATLLRALRERFVTGDDAARLRGIPYALAHLYYKANPRERLSLFSQEVLGRPLG